MMQCSIRHSEWDPKRVLREWVCSLMLLNSMLVDKAVTVTLVDVRVDLLTLVLITEQWGAA